MEMQTKNFPLCVNFFFYDFPLENETKPYTLPSPHN